MCVSYDFSVLGKINLFSSIGDSKFLYFQLLESLLLDSYDEEHRYIQKHCHSQLDMNI